VNARLKFALVTLSACLTIGVTISLGRWQLSRAIQKQDLQAAVEAQGAKTPLSAHDLHGRQGDVASLQHRRARVRGFWVKDATVFLENRPMNGRVGFIVLTPLVMEAGTEAIVVQRGWIPRDFQVRGRLPTIETPPGMVEIEGRLTPPPSKLYEPGSGPLGAIRQNIDLSQFKTETGLSLMPLSLQQMGAESEGLLRDWPAVNLGVQKNQGYALQWFGLAGLVALLYLWFQIIRRFFYRPLDSVRHE